jgi:hypothetical protein
LPQKEQYSVFSLEEVPLRSAMGLCSSEFYQCLLTE